jgi:glycosyltransferase involved in cell wall biosynthesis
VSLVPAPAAAGPGPEPSLDVSVVCAVFNEAEGVKTLVERVAAALRPVGLAFEIVVVDDGSADETLARLKDELARTPELRVVELARNYGQVAAVSAGLTLARGRLIVTMDGDLQHDPADIPRLLEAGRKHDLVATYREKREEGLKRRLVTFVGNRVNRFLTGLPVRDFGSFFRVVDWRLIDGLRDRDGLVHYNTPALYASARRLTQVPITQHRRAFGGTKWTFAMFVSYNLDFVTASPRLTHLLLGTSMIGFMVGITLYALKLAGVVHQVEAASAPAIIALGSMQLAVLGVVWREVIQAQKFAKGVRPFAVRRVWTSEDAVG